MQVVLPIILRAPDMGLDVEQGTEIGVAEFACRAIEVRAGLVDFESERGLGHKRRFGDGRDGADAKQQRRRQEILEFAVSVPGHSRMLRNLSQHVVPHRGAPQPTNIYERIPNRTRRKTGGRLA